jgi:hypothetical protein
MNKKLITQASFWQGLILVALPVISMVVTIILLLKVCGLTKIPAFIIVMIVFFVDLIFRRINFLHQGKERRRFSGFLNFFALIVIAQFVFNNYEMRHISLFWKEVINVIFLAVAIFLRYIEALNRNYDMFATKNGILCRTFAYMTTALIFSQIISLSYSYFATWNVLFPVSCILIFSELVKLYSLDLQRDKYLSKLYIGIAISLFGLSMLFKLTH